MSKRLPYYQSEPAEYLAGDIMFCSYASQGVFSIIRALYWQRDCVLTLTQIKKRCKNAEELIEELIDENIIKVHNDFITINFLKNQFEKASKTTKKNSENGKKGAAARWKKEKENSESIAPLKKEDSESIAFREDKIREDKIREDKIKTIESGALTFLKNSDFDFKLFEMQNKKNVQNWDLMLENFSYKADEENLEYTRKKLESRLRRWMGSWITNENKRKNNKRELTTVHSNR